MAGRVQWEAQVDSNVAKLLSETKELRNELETINKKDIKLDIDSKSLNSIVDLFGKMEGHLKDLKKVFVDVGDGAEFSPLLKTINNIQSSIEKLSASVKNIGFNMNIDVGSDNEMEAKIQSKISNALQAYQRLFEHIKNSGVGGSVINTNFFEFDINQYDTMMAKLQAYRKFIETMRNEAKTQFNGKDVLFQGTNKSYWTSASAAMGQVTKAFNEINASADTSPLENLFGGKTDLTEVVTQLNLIVDKLGEISSTALEFKNTLANGFSVSASVEEIEKLTNRVKELEDELSKVKVSSISPVETNISSPIKDTFQGDKIEQATTSAKELDNTLEQVDIPKDSFDEVINKLKLVEIKAENIVKITKQMRIGEGGKPVESYTLKDKYGSTEIYGVNSDKEKGQLLSANYVEYDAKQAENFQKNLNQAYEEAIKVNNALNETKAKIDGLSKHSELATQFSEVESTIATLNVKLTQGEISVSEYNKAVKETTSSYIKLVDIQQKRDVEVYNADAKKASEDAKRKADEETEALKQKSEAWEKNVKAIQEYMDANTKLNNLKAQDVGTGKKASEIAYQTKEVERLEKVALEARVALSSMINPHEAPIDDWNKWLEAMKQFDQATEGSARSVARLEDALRNMAKSQSDKIGSIIDSNQAHLDKLRPSDGNRSVDFEKAVQEYNKAIIALKEFHATLDSSTPLTKKQSEKYEELSTSLREARIEMEKFSASEKGSTESSRWKEIDKITKYLEKNTRISKIAKQQLEDLVNTLKNVSGVNVDNIHLQFNKIAEAERAAGREGKRFWDILTDKAVYGAAAQLAGYYLSLTDFIRYAGNAITAIRELDTALVDLKKTTSMTSSQLEDFYFDSNDVAKEMGVTTQAIIDQASAWSRLGFSTKEASTEMAKLSAQFAAISPGMDLDVSTDGLVSTMKAFNIEVEDVERRIMDNINKVGNTAATDNTEIIDMLTRSSAAMAVANNTLEETIALETAAVEITRSAESTGTAFKTLSMRIRGYDEETGELSEDLQNISGEIADLTKTAKTPGGISLFSDADKQTYKSTYQILKEISEIYDDLSDKQSAQLLEKLAGKRGGQVVASLLTNFDAAEEALKNMEEAAGSADSEMAIVEESIDYKINALKETWVGVAQEMIDRGDFGKVIDGLVKLSEAIGFVLDKAGLLGTAGIIGGGILGVKNVGIDMLVAC